jgi:hypothetical protein
MRNNNVCEYQRVLTCETVIRSEIEERKVRRKRGHSTGWRVSAREARANYGKNK